MSSKKILYICGSMNQTTMMHKVSKQLPAYESWFSPYYADGFVGKLAQTHLLDFSVLGGQFRERTIQYLKENNLNIDFGGVRNNYDLVFTCSDLVVPENILKDRKSTRLNSSHVRISYAVFCLKKKIKTIT